jgi:hypothetical protein
VGRPGIGGRWNRWSGGVGMGVRSLMPTLSSITDP